MNQIEIFTEYIKLDQSLKLAGIVGQGSDAKMLISEGLVKVNDQICTMRGKKCRPGDCIEVEDEICFTIIAREQ